jgi:MoaA/NifB/PqqE/SkfB family radical SAM enzyme
MPKGVMVEVTNFCNLKCATCPSSQAGRKRGYISLELFNLVLERCKEDLINEIKLYTVGEPLLHPNILDLVEMACSKGLQVVISTNGTLLTKSLIDDLLKAGIKRIQISCGGWNEEIYNSIYIKGDFHLVVENITYLNSRIKSDRLPPKKLLVNSLVPKDLPDGPAKMTDFLLGLGLSRPQMYVHLAHNFAGYNTDGSVDLQGVAKDRVYCAVLDKRIGVFHNGLVTGCPCFDAHGELVIGDIRKQSFREIRRGAEFQRILRCFKVGDLHEVPMCYRCKTAVPLK